MVARPTTSSRSLTPHRNTGQRADRSTGGDRLLQLPSLRKSPFGIDRDRSIQDWVCPFNPLQGRGDHLHRTHLAAANELDDLPRRHRVERFHGTYSLRVQRFRISRGRVVLWIPLSGFCHQITLQKGAGPPPHGEQPALGPDVSLPGHDLQFEGLALGFQGCGQQP